MVHKQKFDIKPNTDLFKKEVEGKLITAIKKYSNARNFSIDAPTQEKINELGKSMRIVRKGGCQLVDFRRYTKNAKDEHIRELDKLLDHINSGIKAVRKFGKRNI